MTEITIVIPVYNAAASLEACIRSIQQQTFTDYTIRAVNDGSTDDSAVILKKYPTIEVINQPNRGAAAARNAGAANCDSPYIIFCDADIVMKPTMLEKMLSSLQQNEQASYAYSSFRYGWKNFSLWEFSEQRLRSMPYIHTTSLIKTEHFPGFDESLKKFQDWDLWLTMLEQGHRGVFVPETLFTIRTGGTMSQWLPTFVYRLPWKPRAARHYEQAREIIKQKHML